MIIHDYTTQYALDVLDGTIIAGNLVKLACQRHLNDLQKEGTEGFSFVFSREKADRAFRFFENLKFTDGDMRGKPVKLVDFQYFIIGNLFGWVDAKTGYRRFSKSYVQLSRKQAKSLLNSGIAIYTAGFCGYQNAQVYTVATKKAQARIVWEQAKKFIEQDKELAALHKTYDRESLIKHKINGGKIVALGRDTNSIDGFEPYTGIVDELHSHKNNQMIKLLQDGTINLQESLISIITTAGFDLSPTNPCVIEYEYCINILNGLGDNDRYFNYIAQMDKEDDIWDSKNWAKCAPLSRHIPHSIKSMEMLAIEAKDKGGEELTNFMTKTLNIWTHSEVNAYINLDKWKACASDMTLDNFIGYEAVIGLDLSSGGDLTSLAIEIPIVIDGVQKFFIHSHSFIPKERLQEHIKSDLAPYGTWLKDGLLTTTPGYKSDYKFILKYLRELKETYNIKFKMICYDPHNADAFLSDLEDFGVPVVEILASARNLNQPTVDFKLEVDSGNIIYNKDSKLLSWSVANAKLDHNSMGECKIDKNLRVKRIDPVDAVIDAHKMAMLQKKEFVMTDEYIDDLYKDYM
ncbi:terminase large subunit [Paenibacillus sp. 19GGS1-52]|uniref:terminase large subunit n=1 Tax=Paenibacillus sp. 19GGS1-52 TaxID=2758563 RepID=UPI001EFB9DA9|nr:terminase TerL endonuclease subunit [Paenibacillus sp. 19GGS1-52]ULO09662.1 terminase large subunit [Paenibacillus sp. 19GGS1-52]